MLSARATGVRHMTPGVPESDAVPYCRHFRAWTHLLLPIVLQIWSSAHANLKQGLYVRLEQLRKQSALASSYFLLIVLHANGHAVSKVAIVPSPPP